MQMFQWELMIKKKKEKLYNLMIDKRKYFTIWIVKNPKWNARIPFRWTKELILLVIKTIKEEKEERRRMIN